MTSGLYPASLASAILHAVDTAPVAERLPDSYRRVLDRVADLEAAGHRREADLVRGDAIAAYSRRWNERAARRLERLVERAERVLDGRESPRPPYRSTRRAAPGWLSIGPVRLRRGIAHLAPRSADPTRPDLTTEHPPA